jgi:hypothetical protein
LICFIQALAKWIKKETYINNRTEKQNIRIWLKPKKLINFIPRDKSRGYSKTKIG